MVLIKLLEQHRIDHQRFGNKIPNDLISNQEKLVLKQLGRYEGSLTTNLIKRAELCLAINSIKSFPDVSNQQGNASQTSSSSVKNPAESLTSNQPKFCTKILDSALNQQGKSQLGTILNQQDSAQSLTLDQLTNPAHTSTSNSQEDSSTSASNQPINSQAIMSKIKEKTTKLILKSQGAVREFERCKICNHFVTKSGLSSHNFAHSLQETKSIMKCNFCDFKTFNLNVINRHINGDDHKEMKQQGKHVGFMLVKNRGW
jgi:hypothetical protein